MRWRSVSPLCRIVSANWRCSRVSGVPRRRLVIPMTPFIGVRISWLIVARKALLARLASSASRVAASSSAVRAATSSSRTSRRRRCLRTLRKKAPATSARTPPATAARNHPFWASVGSILTVVFAPVAQAPVPRRAATSKT